MNIAIPVRTVSPRTLGPRGMALLKYFEHCVLRAMLPTRNDRPTLGWGETNGIQMGMTWTQEEADARLNLRLNKVCSDVAGALRGADATNWQFGAMVCLAYNIGMGRGDRSDPEHIPGFGNSHLLELHCVGDFEGARAAFAPWDKQAGQVLGGLEKRRAAEASLYAGDYDTLAKMIGYDG